MNFRYSDNTSDSLAPGSGGKAVAKWDTHAQAISAWVVTSRRREPRPDPGGGQPEGVRNARQSPQIKHSRSRQWTLIATTLCADTQLTWPPTLHKADHFVTLLRWRTPERRSRGPGEEQHHNSVDGHQTEEVADLTRNVQHFITTPLLPILK